MSWYLPLIIHFTVVTHIALHTNTLNRKMSVVWNYFTIVRSTFRKHCSDKNSWGGSINAHFSTANSIVHLKARQWRASEKQIRSSAEAAGVQNNGSLSVTQAFDSKRQFSADIKGQKSKDSTQKIFITLDDLCYKCYKYIRCILL